MTKKHKSSDVTCYNVKDLSKKEAQSIGGKLWEVWQKIKLEDDLLKIVKKA